MNFKNYMQLELKPELNENIIRFKNVVKLDGEYEVALIDIMYEHYSQTIENRKYDVSIIKDENLIYASIVIFRKRVLSISTHVNNY